MRDDLGDLLGIDLLAYQRLPLGMPPRERLLGLLQLSRQLALNTHTADPQRACH